MMKLVILVSVCLVQALAMTTKHHGHHNHQHGTGPTKEPIENEKFFFKYDPTSQMLMAIVGAHKCFLYSVTSDEMTAVHTSHGLHTLEMKMITAIDDTTMTYTTMTHDDLMAASKLLAHACHAGDKTTIMKIN